MTIRVSYETIQVLNHLAMGADFRGAGKLSPHQSLKQLNDFFKQFVAWDVYFSGSRGHISNEYIKSINNEGSMKELIEGIVDPRRYLNTEFNHEDSMNLLNEYLEHDGYQLVNKGKRIVLQPLQHITVSVSTQGPASGILTIEHIEEELRKCDDRLLTGDLKGAITNARSLVESILREIEKRQTGIDSPYDGDLPKLYKRVSKLMNLDQQNPKLSQAQGTILKGLDNIIHGLAPFSSEYGDRHGTRNKPEMRHAKLAVNSAKTVAEFICESYEHQITTGKIKDATHAP